MIKWGRAPVSLAFAITAARIHPAVKYARGHGKACTRIVSFALGLGPAGPPTPSLAGTPAPRSARVARSRPSRATRAVVGGTPVMFGRGQVPALVAVRTA